MSTETVPGAYTESPTKISPGERKERFEELTPENLTLLEAELKKYDDQPDTETFKKTKAGRKKVEKEVRTRLVKEQKAAKKISTPVASSSSTPSSDGCSSSSVPSESEPLVNIDAAAPEMFATAASSNVGKRVHIKGWISQLQWHGKNLAFFHVRDSTGYIQCIAAGKVAKSGELAKLTRETCVHVFGTVQAGKGKSSEFEVVVDFIEIVGECPVEFENLLNEDSGVDQKLELRHLYHRSETTMRTMRVRSRLLWEFRKFLYGHRFEEVTPPTLVKNSCEGGCKMFEVKYYNQQAFLTESSQLYLETVIQSLGNVFCVLPSYRAEESLTRRHLSEFTHLEAEMPFFDFEKFLQFIEEFVCTVTQAVAESAKDDIAVLNPAFKPLKRPFKRMTYTEALEWLEKNGITNPKTGKPYVFPEDVPEMPERKLVDTLGEPILLMKFPTVQKAFYMKKTPEDARFTESVDLIVPGVGEIMGGSVRIHDYEELMAMYKEREMDPKPLYWYNDVRKYGSVPHAGFGFGLERVLCWVANRDHIRDACMYPRYMGRLTP